MDSVEYVFASRGLTNRHPIVVSTSSMFPRAKARSGLSAANGARDIDSTPPARTSSASPTRICRAAWTTASRPEAQRRLTVAAGTSTGRPAKSAAIRATFRLSSPAWFAQPM
jgi:hypothetical protein